MAFGNKPTPPSAPVPPGAPRPPMPGAPVPPGAPMGAPKPPMAGAPVPPGAPRPPMPGAPVPPGAPTRPMGPAPMGAPTRPMGPAPMAGAPRPPMPGAPVPPGAPTRPMGPAPMGPAPMGGAPRPMGPAPMGPSAPQGPGFGGPRPMGPSPMGPSPMGGPSFGGPAPMGGPSFGGPSMGMSGMENRSVAVSAATESAITVNLDSFLDVKKGYKPTRSVVSNARVSYEQYCAELTFEYFDNILKTANLLEKKSDILKVKKYLVFALSNTKDLPDRQRDILYNAAIRFIDFLKAVVYYPEKGIINDEIVAYMPILKDAAHAFRGFLLKNR